MSLGDAVRLTREAAIHLGSTTRHRFRVRQLGVKAVAIEEEVGPKGTRWIVAIECLELAGELAGMPRPLSERVAALARLSTDERLSGLEALAATYEEALEFYAFEQKDDGGTTARDALGKLDE